MIPTLLVCVTVLVIGYRVEPFVDRLIQIKERGRDDAAPVPANAPKATPEPITIPDDLEAVALLESEPWAQADQRALIKEKYFEHGRDWNRVRRAVGVGEID